MKAIDRSHNAFMYYAVLATLYLILNFTLPTSKATIVAYHLSGIQYHVLLIFVTLPFVLIWLVAFYGYSMLKQYSSLIRSEAEGPAFNYLANGLMILAWGLPIPAILSIILSAIAGSNSGFNATAIVITNYANLLPPLIAFHILSNGSRTLLEKSQLKISIGSIKKIVLLFVILGTAYSYFAYNSLGSQKGGHSHNPYYLPVWLILLTIVVPYLYTWFIGLLAAYETHLVSNGSSGLLYQQALRHLSRGLAVIVTSSIAFQYLRSIVPHDGHGITLGYILLLTYGVLLSLAAGYALLAYGAKKLMKIEEV